MPRGVLPWLAVGGAAATLVYLGVRSWDLAIDVDTPPEPTRAPRSRAGRRRAEVRNASLVYRPIGRVGERYPEWVRALRGKSGVYVIREIQADGSELPVYVGESHTGRLYQTLTRHFQTWRRYKKFWAKQYGGQGHDPGLTYPRDKVTVAARVLSDERAMVEEARLIAKIRPRDNLLGQPEDVVPF